MIQTQVINYFLDSKDTSLITLNNLNRNYFSEYGAEWTYIENHLREYGNIPDKETFLNVFPDFELIQVSETPAYLIAELFKDYQTRQLATSFNKVREDLMNGNLEKALETYKNINESLTAGISLQCIDLIKDTSRYDAYVERTKDFGKYYISTGFPELDAIIGGWDREEELATIIARTNQGKSWILIKCAEAAVKQGLTVGLYSGEMSERKVGYRFDTLAGHVSNGALTHGNESVMKEYQQYMSFLPKRYPGSLKVLTPAMINGPAGVNALRAFIEKEHLDILMIDQHSLLEDDRKAKNPVEKAANISKDLKNLQVLKRIPIISVSQMNREKNESNPDMIDSAQIAQTDRIGQDSTCIIGISRDKKDNSLMKLQLVKSRDSENGKVLSYIVDFNKGTFTFIPEEEKEDDHKNAGPEERIGEEYGNITF